MDLTQGLPIITEDTSTLHSGHCTDSEFGCIACWNAQNNHEGRIFKCDWCKVKTNTRVTRAFDEPAMYALCEQCRKKNDKYAQEEYERMTENDIAAPVEYEWDEREDLYWEIDGLEQSRDIILGEIHEIRQELGGGSDLLTEREQELDDVNAQLASFKKRLATLDG